MAWRELAPQEISVPAKGTPACPSNLPEDESKCETVLNQKIRK